MLRSSYALLGWFRCSIGLGRRGLWNGRPGACQCQHGRHRTVAVDGHEPPVAEVRGDRSEGHRGQPVGDRHGRLRARRREGAAEVHPQRHRRGQDGRRDLDGRGGLSHARRHQLRGPVAVRQAVRRAVAPTILPDVTKWVSSPRNEGPADVGGVPTIKITGTANTTQIQSDLQAIGSLLLRQAATGSPATDATVEVYTGAADSQLRRLVVAGQGRGRGTDAHQGGRSADDHRAEERQAVLGAAGQPAHQVAPHSTLIGAAP